MVGRMRGPITVRSRQEGVRDCAETSAEKGVHWHTAGSKNQSVTESIRICAAQQFERAIAEISAFE